MSIEHDSKIFIAGHRGLVGSAIWHELERQGFHHLLGRNRQELDLSDATSVESFYAMAKPEYVFVAAAKVGGILANDQQPASFLQENLRIQDNLIHGEIGRAHV